MKSDRGQEKIKRIIIRKKVKLSSFVDDMVSYEDNPKDPIQNLVEPIIKYSAVEGHRINIIALHFYAQVTQILKSTEKYMPCMIVLK